MVPSTSYVTLGRVPLLSLDRDHAGTSSAEGAQKLSYHFTEETERGKERRLSERRPRTGEKSFGTGRLVLNSGEII